MLKTSRVECARSHNQNLGTRSVPSMATYLGPRPDRPRDFRVRAEIGMAGARGLEYERKTSKQYEGGRSKLCLGGGFFLWHPID